MELESLREDLLDFCDMVHPNLDALKNNYLSIEDVIDFVIYESIKAAYDEYAPKKSLRQHMIENGLDSDADRRRFSRQIQYAQYYRDLQQERIADRTGIEIDELSGKDMDNIDDRMAGHELNDMQFFELNNMLNMPVLKKIMGHQITSSKKVSNKTFVELMDEYDGFVKDLKKDMDTPEKILFNSEAYFTLDWHYNIDIIYRIVIEAEKHGYPAFNPYNVRGIMGELSIPPTTRWFSEILTTECRMVLKRKDMLTLVYDISSEEREEFMNYLAEFYRLRKVIKSSSDRKSVVELAASTSLEERVNFIKSRQWVWDAHVDEKEWDVKRIKYAREIFEKMYLPIKQPKID